MFFSRQIKETTETIASFFGYELTEFEDLKKRRRFYKNYISRKGFKR